MILINDDPIKTFNEDRLSVRKQVAGFAKFIRVCDTPLTISVQGKWGSGKTSFFELVKTYITEKQKKDGLPKCKFVDFNAWQYSQFNSDSELPSALLVSLVKQIGGVDAPDKKKKDSKDTKETLKLLGSILAYAGNKFIVEKTGINVIETSKEVTDGIKKTKDDINGMIPEELHNEQLVDFVQAINSLKQSFIKNVENCLGDDKDSRLVIFVDDLDRLLPEKAIGLLEVMKVFLDSPRCVFILAIDYDVVINGVAAKYKNTISGEKSRDYFEKMIQVVFRLPNSVTNMEEYIKGMLDKQEVNLSAARDFAILVKVAGKDNPRSVKRLINNFFLVRTIGIESGSYNPRDFYDDDSLFAFVCLQEIYPKLFDLCCSNIKQLGEFFKEMYTKLDEIEKEIGMPLDDDFIDSFLVMANKPIYKNLIPEELYFDNVDEIKQIIKVMNYSDDRVETVSKIILVVPNLLQDFYHDRPRGFKNDDDLKTAKGTVEEAYQKTLGLISKHCHITGKKMIAHDIDFVELVNGELVSSGKRSDLEYEKCLSELADYLEVKIKWVEHDDWILYDFGPDIESIQDMKYAAEYINKFESLFDSESFLEES